MWSLLILLSCYRSTLDVPVYLSSKSSGRRNRMDNRDNRDSMDIRDNRDNRDSMGNSDSGDEDNRDSMANRGSMGNRDSGDEDEDNRDSMDNRKDEDNRDNTDSTCSRHSRHSRCTVWRRSLPSRVTRRRDSASWCSRASDARSINTSRCRTGRGGRSDVSRSSTLVTSTPIDVHSVDVLTLYVTGHLRW